MSVKKTFSNVAKLIRDKRENSSYSQDQLSHELGYKGGQFISNVERSLCSMPVKKLVNTVRILKIEPKDMKEAMMKDYEIYLDSYLQTAPNRSEYKAYE